MPPARALRIAGIGHALFAAALMWLGILMLMKGGFVPPWTGVPHDLPGRAIVADLCALIMLGCGVGVLVPGAAAVASRVLVVFVLLWMALFRIPLVFQSPLESGVWWACGETSVMLAAAWVLLAWSGGRPAFAIDESGLRIARVLYGLGLIPFGIAHFTFLDRTVSMVPGWLPWHHAWAYVTGSLLVLAGVAIVVGVLARLAAILSTLEMALFTLLVWVPVVVRGTDAANWSEFVDSCVLTAAAWLVADSWRPRTQDARSSGVDVTQRSA